MSRISDQQRRHGRRTLRAALVTFTAGVVALLTQGTAHAITGGTPVPDTATGRATVYLFGTNTEVGSVGCSGVLVRPDIVLSAGHCVTHHLVPVPAPHTPYRDRYPGWDQWENPGQWYPLYSYSEPGERLEIRVGVNRSDPDLIVRAEQYALMGNSDMILLRLQDSVPTSLAKPAPVLTRQPAQARGDISGFWSRQKFVTSGWGGVSVLAQGSADQGVYPDCPRSRFGDTQKMCVRTTGGSRIVGGDSGSPLYWDDPADGVRYVIGVAQGLDSIGGRYTVTFFDGGRGWDGTPRPDLSRFLETNLGAADIAYTWVSGGYASPTYSHAPGGLPVTATRLGTGRVRVHLPFPGPDSRGSVQVTGYGAADPQCVAYARVSDNVYVSCRDNAGNLVDGAFSVLISSRATDAYALANRPTTSSYTPGLWQNPSGSTPAITRVGTGYYVVGFPGTSQTLRNVLVTAYGWTTNRCHVLSWSSTQARVRCENTAGLPADTVFWVLAATGYDQRYDEAFTWGSRATTASYTPSSVYTANPFNNPAGVRITRTGTGSYVAGFSGLAGIGGDVQVTAYGSGAGRCHVAWWGESSATIRCLDTDGDLADLRFVVRYLKPIAGPGAPPI